MKTTSMKTIITLATTFALAVTVLLIAGCASTPADTRTESGPSGSRLWAQNCTRCHNSRSPSDYSGVQWEVAMLHMRIRANLTPEEHRKILEFLQTRN